MIKKNICTFEEWIKELGELAENELEAAHDMYDRLLDTLERFTPKDHEERGLVLQHNVYPFQKTGGKQMISHPNNVLDEAKSFNPNSWNFHGQNLSRNLFTCGIVFDTEYRNFSMHT